MVGVVGVVVVFVYVFCVESRFRIKGLYFLVSEFFVFTKFYLIGFYVIRMKMVFVWGAVGRG